MNPKCIIIDNFQYLHQQRLNLSVTGPEASLNGFGKPEGFVFVQIQILFANARFTLNFELKHLSTLASQEFGSRDRQWDGMKPGSRSRDDFSGISRIRDGTGMSFGKPGGDRNVPFNSGILAIPNLYEIEKKVSLILLKYTNSVPLIVLTNFGVSEYQGQGFRNSPCNFEP